MLRCTDTLPSALYTASAVRELDRLAIEGGIPGIQLMQRAGRAAFAQLQAHWPDCRRLHVFCGGGNNGGDGYVIAALAQERGIATALWQLAPAENLKGDAQLAYRRARDAGVPMNAWDTSASLDEGVVVDALLGTGIKGELRSEYRAAIEAINGSGLPVLAVDIPSGLCSDSGRSLGATVRADCTITFIGLKRGLVTGDAADYVGELIYSDLQVPDSVFAQVQGCAELLALDTLLARHLPPRARSAHKGHFGHVLVIGGDFGMAGAACLAATAAARCGAGLVSCATRPEHVGAVVAHSPEIMVHGIEASADLEPLLERASVVVIGPGLGRGDWSTQLLRHACRSERALVLDADALNLLAAKEAQLPDGGNWILTPHPGEASRLLEADTAAVQSDRYASAAQLQQRWGGTVILKGAGTLVADSHGLAVSRYGNPGMASGGMGDVLSGILGGLIAQGLDIASAAKLGACLHGRAGDLAATGGERGLLAGDLIDQLRTLVNT